MMAVPAVSVLMPCYNAAATLDEALQSLALQSLRDYEIIAVDDGSQDATGQILKEWSQREARLRVIHQEHAGIITALNIGLSACQAPLVARMDSDDRAHPERLARQADYLYLNPQVGIVSCKVTAFPSEQVREGFQIYLDWLNALMSDADIRREIFIESPLPHPSVMFRREVVVEAGGYQEHGWAEDYDLWLRLYLAGVGFARLPDVLLEWRERPERLTRSDARYSLENFLRAKAYYLSLGPLHERDGVFIWGAGMVGRRLGRQLQRRQADLAAFIDIDPRKIGRTRCTRPILSPDELMERWRAYQHPALLAAVGARGARPLIRQRLIDFGLVEGIDWWSAA